MAINKKLITFDKKLTFLGANGINNLSSPVDGYYNLIPTWSMVFIKDTGEIWHDGVYFGKPIKDQIAPIMSGTTKGIVFTPNGTDYYYKDFNLWGNTFDGDTKNINGDLVVQGVTYKWTYGDLGIKKGNTNLISFSNSANDYDVFIPNGDLLVTGGDINVNNGKVILDSTGYIKGTHILNTNSYFNADNTLGKTWSSIKQFNTSGTTISLDTTRPAIINIQEHAHASGTLWVPWIAGGDITEQSSWGIGLGGDAFYIGRIAKSHTENSLSEYWKFDSEDGITISGTTKYIKVAGLTGASEKIFMADGTVKAISDLSIVAQINEATTTDYGGFKLTQAKASTQQALVSNTTGNGRYAVKMNANGTLYVEFAQANTWLPATNSQEGYVPQLSGENDAIGSSLNDYVLTFTSSDAETIYPTWRRLPSNAFDNTWRGIYVNDTSKLGTGTTTKPINFKAGNGITLTFTAAGDGTYNTLQIDGTTYSTATDSVLGLVKVGTTLDDVSGFTAVHIKDGVIYYKDTTYSFSKLKFQQTSGTDLMTYDSQAARTILAGDNITFTHSSNVLTIKATDTTYSVATSSVLGLIKIGTTLDNVSGYTKVHIKDGFAYYHDTTYSFSKLKFLLTSGTDLMTYDSLAVRTILAGDNITFTHSNNVLTIKATDTTYSTASSSALGLVKTGAAVTDTTGMTAVHIKDGVIYYKDTNTTYSTATNSALGLVKVGDTINDVTGYTAVHINNGKIYYKDTNTTYSAATSSTLGLVKIGDTLSDATGYTKVAIKDGIIYYKDTNTTYSTATSSTLGLVKVGDTINDTTGYTAVHINNGKIYYKDTNTTYSTATSSALGLVKIGSTITDTTGYTKVAIKNGVIYYKDTNTTYSTATSSALGLIKVGDTLTDTTGYTKVAIKDGFAYYKDTNTTYSTATSSTLGLVKVGDTISDATGYTACKIKDGVIYYKDTNTTYSTVSKTAAGLCPALPNETTTTKYLRLDGSWVAPPNDNTWRGIYVGGTSKVGTGTNTLPINFVAGSNVSITYEAAGTGSGQSGNARYFNVKIVATDTTYSDFVKSGSTAAHGLVPKPPTTAGTTKYLREDGTWQTPPNNNTWKPANTSLEGYAPKLATGGGTIATQSTEYVLTFKSGTDSAPVWRLLPANAYNDHTYTVNNGTYSIKSKIGNTTTTVSDFTANQSGNDDFTLIQGSNITFTNDTTNKTITIAGKAGTVTSVASGIGLTGGTITSTGTLKVKLKDETLNSADSSKSTSSNGGLYSIEADKSGDLAVRVPWTNTTYSVFTTSANGLAPMASSANKLDAETAVGNYYLCADGKYRKLPANAFKNTNTWRNIYTGGTSRVGTGTNTKAINFVAGSNVSISYEAAGTSSGQSGSADYFNIKIAATNTTYSAGTGLRLSGTQFISDVPRVSKDSKVGGGWRTWIMEEYTASANYNLPSNAYYHIMSTQGDDTTYETQLALGMTTDGVYYRRNNGGTWGDWKSLINTDTTYSANNGVGLSGTTFYNSGVRAATINGNYLRVNTNGTNADLTIPYASSAGSVAWANITSKPNLVSIGSDGVSEVGQYMDFHYGSTTSDYSVRLDVTADSQVVVHLPTSSGTLALYSQIPTNNNQLTNGAGYVTSSGVTSVATGTGLTGGTITSTGTISINSTYQTYISHGESAYNSLGNYLPLSGGTMNNGCKIYFDERYGANYISGGTGDGASYSTYNISIGSWYGFALVNTCTGGDRVDGASWYCNVRYGHTEQKGDCYAANFYTTSDRNKKKNISSLSEHIRKFTLKDSNKDMYGVIALEVPEMFREGSEGNMTVNYNSILSYYVGILENKVKELEEKIKILENNNLKQ